MAAKYEFGGGIIKFVAGIPSNVSKKKKKRHGRLERECSEERVGKGGAVARTGVRTAEEI